MPAKRSNPSLAQQLAAARARIAELETTNGKPKAASLQPPSFILESITDAFVAVDREFRFIWVNGEAERLLGMPRNRILGRSMWELLPCAPGSAFEEKCRQTLASQRPSEFEYFYGPGNRWFFNKAYPTQEGGLAIYWRDITDQKRLQTDLHSRALVLEQVHESIIMTDLEGRITHWNHGARQIFGYESQEVVGSHVSILYFEEDRERVDSTVLQPLLRDGQGEIEMRNRRKSGEECYIRLSLSLLRDDSNQPCSMLGVATDITAQKKAEKELRETEERYRCLAEAMPQIAYVTGPDGKTNMLNGRWEQYSGISAEQCLDFNWLSWVHPEDATAIMPRWLECLRTGEHFDMEYRLRNAAGEYRWQLSRAVPVRGASGTITHWVGTLTDIHERKSTEEALRKSEEQFRLASQAVQGIVYDWYPQTGVVHRSGDLESIVGISVDQAEATDSWWQKRVHPEDAAKSTLNLTPTLGHDRNSFETEFRIRHADGHWVYACDRGFIIRDETGSPVRVVGNSYNVSERKRLEREIEESNRRLKFQADIISTTNDAVIALDRNQLITYCNAGAERMYRVSCSDVTGKPLSEMYEYSWLNPEDEQRAWSDLAEFGTWKGENIHILKDGTRIIVSSTVNVLANESGGGMVAVIRDISEQKKAELERQKQAADLARANEDLLHFAYAVSHDLQAPLRTVTSFSQLLALKYKARLDEQAGEFIKMIVDSGSRMSAMIRDLLELAKCGGSEITFCEGIALEEVIRSALDNLGSAVRETGAVITHGALPVVAGDAGQLTQLFQNLIGNSIKYRKADTVPEIHISAERNLKEWVISVSDNGIGFQANQTERIFGVFNRLHGAEYAGTGVGLTICKRIVERRGGRIWATATPGKGARFAFSIPDDTAVIRPVQQLTAPTVTSTTVHAHTPARMEGPRDTSAPFDELFHMLDLAQAMVRDLDGRILVWTQGAEHLFGWPKHEAVGQHAHTLLRTEFPKPFLEIEADLLRDGEWAGQLRKVRRDGGAVWVASHWTLYRDGSGRPQSVIEVNNDITALKETEQALLQSSAQRDLALRAGQMGIWRWDIGTGVVEWDATIERFYGMEAGSFERTYEAFERRIHPDDRTLVAVRVAEAFKQGPEYTIEFRGLRADGSYIWVRGQGQVIRVNGEAVGMVGVVWDISLRKQHELDQQFLLELSAKLSKTSDRRQLGQLAVDEVGALLGVSRCSYIEVDSQAGLAEVVADYRTEGPSILGTHSVDKLGQADAFGQAISELASERVVAVNDTLTDPLTANAYRDGYRPLEIRAYAAAPLHQGSTWRAFICASHADVHPWQEREIAILRAAAERLWPNLENARLLKVAQEKQEQFEATFDHAAIGIAHVDLSGRWLRVNDRVCEITGYPRAELLASRFQDITHPEDLESDLDQYATLKRGEIQSYSLEKRYLHKSGWTVWINLTVSLVREASGEPKYAIAVIEDITVRKKTARELQENIALAALRLREIEAIYSQAPVGLLFLDNDLRYVRINDYLARMNGLPAADHIGRTVSEVLPELGAHLCPLLKNVIETRVPIVESELQGPIRGKEIERTWLVSYFPVEGADGSIVGLNGVVQDITERKRAEAALRETTERLAIATSAAQLGVMNWDVQASRMSWENQRMYEIFGRHPADGPISREEFFSSIVHPDDAAAVVQSSNASLTSGAVFRQSCRIRRADGEMRWVEFIAQPEISTDGTPLRITGVTVDITDRKEAEAALRENAERLRIATSAARLGVFTWQVQGDRAHWENERMYEIVGRNREDGPVNAAEFLKKVVYPNDADAFEKALTGAVESGRPFHHECRIRRQDDGAIRWVEFSGQFELAPDGSPVRLIGVMADITGRIEAEQASRDRRQLLLKVLDSLYTFVGVMSPEGVLLEANRAPLEAAGIRADEVLGKLVTDTYWWSYSTDVQNRLWEAIHKAQAGEPSRFDIKARMKGGALMTLDFMLCPLRDETGKVAYLIPSAVSVEERTQAEEALRRSEERYLLAEWATNDGLWDWDPTTDDCYFSPRFKALLGFEDEEVENKADAVFSRMHPEDAQILFSSVRLHFDEQRPYDIEIRVRLKDGSYRWFRTRGQAVRDHTGKVVRMVGSMSDIHDRKMAEAFSREQDKQLRLMIDSIEQLAWIARADGYIFWYNQRWYEYTGTTPEQMEGWGWQSVHDPKVLPDVLECWQASIQTGQPMEMEFPLRGGDGVYRAFLTRVVPVRDSQGNIVRWFGTNTNIDELRKEQDQLKESERRFRELAEALPEMMWESSGDGKVVYCNPQWYTYTGAPKEEGLEHNWVSIIHPDDAPQLFEKWQKALANGQHYEYESRVRRHDGIYRWFLNRAEPVRDQQGKIVKWLGTSTDIHEQKLTEQALRRSNEDLEQFAYAASHDLQEPLRMVSIYSQLLSESYGGQGDEAEKFAGYVVRGAKQMESLLKGILAYSRAGDPIEGPATCDSGAAMNEALRSLEPSIQKSGATIVHGDLPMVAFPEAPLVRVFQDLIDNAIKYHGAQPPQIRVSTVLEGRWQKFSIQDNGIGIRPEYLERIFGVFKRLHRDEYPGVGVGLAICKRAVERYGGRIWAESEFGKGTTFHFTVPAAG